PKSAMPTGAGSGLRGTETAAAISIICLLFAAILTFGSDRNDFSFLFSALFAFLVLLLVAGEKWARDILFTRAHRLGVPAAFFLVSLFAIAWPATPYVPGGAHPIWAYVQTLPAIAIDRSTIFVGLTKLAGLACAFLVGWVVCSSDNRARFFLRCFVAGISLYGAWALLAKMTPALKFGLYNTFQ